LFRLAQLGICLGEANVGSVKKNPSLQLPLDSRSCHRWIMSRASAGHRVDILYRPTITAIFAIIGSSSPSAMLGLGE
jgi:hypothetical protein